MYKEKCERNKIPFLALIVITAALLLSASGALKQHPVTGRFAVVCDITLSVMFFLFLYSAVRSINMEMKYSLISGELLVQKKIDGKTEVTDRVYTDDITGIQEVKNLGGRVVCGFKDVSCFFRKTYRITYNMEGKTGNIYIRPTDKFVSKLKESAGRNRFSA